ncbi:MAG TPA: glycosyltransferase [Miltoncostaeaceae bacterium]|nr:glycosyltransferase [Miltoncostaeaceae bacterium]
MLRQVNVGHKSLADYHSIVSRDLMAEIRELAAGVRGLRVCHVNATAFGGGVAEILYSLVPLMNDVGLRADWKVMFGRDDFFTVTKKMHNALQGADQPLTDEDKRVFERYNLLNAGGMSGDYDVVIVHDPQPAGMRGNVPALDDARWIWRCHIDLSAPQPDVLEFLRPMIQGYDLTVFHMAEYIPAGAIPDPVVMPPAIDPLAPKNMALSAEDAAYIVNQFGLDVERPVLLQVSRFDPWKDPLGVIDAYRLVKEEVPGVQLALVGSMATDDPEGFEYYNRTVDYAAADPDIYILSNLNNVGGVEVNAFQTQAAAVVQKSIREGFGLTVTEALWKARPTVAGKVGGIPLQVLDGETGYLVSSAEECADRILRLLREPEAARAMARRGKQHVRHDFLTPRLLRDWLGILRRVSARSH